MSKKPVVIYSASDTNNFKYSVMMFNSLTKFHDPKKVDMILYTDEKRPEELQKLPKGIKVVDLSTYLKDDPMFFYRQKPLLSEPLLDQYDCVIGLDSDQLVLGDLSYIWKTQGYDVATVINWNRVDPQQYGVVQGWGIAPIEYFNCGLVALRSKKFSHHWKVLCYTEQFNRMQYKEQDLLNVLCYYGNYNVRCLDHGDGVAKTNAWWGLISKGEWGRTQVDKDGSIFVTRGLGDTPFPPQDMPLKVIHFGGGNTPNKMNYKLFFPEEVAKRLDELVKPV